MATDKKHIAVYLDPAVEQALIAFCKQKGLKSKKGFMYSAGVNAALAQFFGIANIDNILQSSGTTPNPTVSNTPDTVISNIPPESIDVETLPGKSEGLSDSDTDSLRQELEALRAENQRWEEAFNELQGEKDDLDTYLQEARSQLETLKTENEALRTAQPVAELELPDPADALNQLKAMYKASKANLRDVKALWGMIEK
jgi:FtsZ-binding cell division protein ZapB